jgi:hypothetical protein
MAYGQSTLEEIIESERAMVLDGKARYGQHYEHARATTMYLSLFVVSMEHDRSDTFGRLLSLMKKQHILAFLSALRLHNVQAMMNLRQVLEAGAAAAYSIANPQIEDFVDIDSFGIMYPSQGLTKKRYSWIDVNYPAKSKWVKEKKDQVNNQAAHASILGGNRTFRILDGGKTVGTPFFDIEDEVFVKVDLWLISSVAVTLMDFFFGVAHDVAQGGRLVVEFRPDFRQTIGRLGAESDALRDELQGSDRYKAVMRRQAQRARAPATADTSPSRPSVSEP